MLTIRQDILERYGHLFGTKTVNGVTLTVEDLIGRMTAATADGFPTILAARRRRILEPAPGRAGPDPWTDAEQRVVDPDGDQRTVGQIRQGMIDRFLGRRTQASWRLNQTVRVPASLLAPGMQGTGPFIDLGMAMGAINAGKYGASSWMPDSEDAGGDFKGQLYQQWDNLTSLVAGRHKHGDKWSHPTKRYKANHPDVVAGIAHEGEARTYSVQLARRQWPALVHRVPSVHLRNRQITWNGQPVPATIPALVIYALNNFDALRSIRQHVAFYIPKIETAAEALLIGKLLKMLEEGLGLTRGTIKIEMLNERGEYTIAQPQIMWVLRKNLIGPNVGRWDYLNSLIEMFKDDGQKVFPDPHTITMTAECMTEYTRRNALLTLLVGGMPIGGMAAQMQNPSKPENDAKAYRAIWLDKLRERLTGLIEIDGKIHDTYRQSWGATTVKGYVEAGVAPLGTPLDQLQKQVDQVNDEEGAVLQKLGLVRLEAGRYVMSPYRLTRDELTVERLFSPQAFEALFHRPAGDITETGLRLAIYYATEYMYQQLQGNNAAAIGDPLTGIRFMNDLATYEIFWHWVWTVVHHEAPISRQDAAIGPGGPLVRSRAEPAIPETLKLEGHATLEAGQQVTADRFLTLVQEREEVVNRLFAEFDRKRIAYDRGVSDLVLQIYRRQVLHPNWIKYGSRVLLSVIEINDPDLRAQILDATFAESRTQVVAMVDQGRWDRQALKVHDYVYDQVQPQGAGEPDLASPMARGASGL